MGSWSVWEEGRPWLYFDDNQDRMFCKLCKKWERKHRSGKRVWNEAPCICIRSNSVLRHEQPDQHKEAVELEKQSNRVRGMEVLFIVFIKFGKLKKNH